ncbi:MAG: ABC transporter substrate-binding protein [Actinomycetota bacterium]|nr:ABC transporter substrate-binding protein [Actinomycetota bacterium]
MSRRKRRVLLLSLAAVGVLTAIFVQPGSTSGVREGGIFRVSFQGISLQAFDHVDPALAYSRESWTLLDTVCVRLLRYRDRPAPQGYGLVPEVAAAFPKVSPDGRTYTFRLRKGLRFSDGSPLRADAFAQAIHRTLAPGVDSPAYLYTRAIVGADDVRAGRATRASGVVARGNTLVVRFTREVRDFAAWTTMPFFCAVPPALPPNPEGVRAFPGGGPYYIREYRPGERVVIRRNRYYGGDREHHVDGFDVDLSATSPQEVLDRIETGKADWGYALPAIHFEPGRALISKYGINNSRFFVLRGLTLSLYVLNSSRPLFRDNPDLRRAVNVALNRTELVLRGAEQATDQYLPPLVQGFKDHRIYPLEGDTRRAKALAERNLRGGKAVFYVPDFPQKLGSAQVLQERLAEIGLDVEIRKIAEYATTSAYRGRLGDADEPWDLAIVIWTPDFVDPSGYVNRLLDAQSAGGTNLARFDEEPFIDLMRRAARREGSARDNAYAALDLQLGRDAAPLVPIAVLNEATLVSARAGCLLLRPGLVLTTVCLKK